MKDDTMNERIQELALLAYNSTGADQVESLSPQLRIFAEKLTELVAAECAGLCYVLACGLAEHGFVGHATADECGTHIEEYFGIDLASDQQCPCGEDGGTSCGAVNCYQLTGENYE